MNKYEEELKVAKEIARAAGVIMLKYFDIEQERQRKGDKSLVTVADKQINRMVIEELSKHFDDIIIGEEESTGELGMGRRWFCDPIDGTRAYVWGTPTAMFSLGLVVDGVPVMGVAYDPFLDKMYEGVVGHGSYMNGVKLEVSKDDLSNGILGVSSSVKRIFKNLYSFSKLRKKGAELAMFSGAVYKTCLVARGRFVGALFDGVSGHDMAATHVILEEAGGKLTDHQGKILDYSKPFLGVVVSNGLVHEELLKSLKIF